MIATATTTTTATLQALYPAAVFYDLHYATECNDTGSGYGYFQAGKCANMEWDAVTSFNVAETYPGTCETGFQCQVQLYSDGACTNLYDTIAFSQACRSTSTIKSAKLVCTGCGL
jgi:hypothetical protein